MTEKGFATNLVPLHEIRESKFHSRVESNGKIEELAESIKSVGLLEPLVVRLAWDKETRTKYEVMAGDRRFRALKLAGKKMAPCVIREIEDDLAAYTIQARENLDRNEYTEKDKVNMITFYAEHFGKKAKEIAEILDKSIDYVLTYLPDKFKDQKKSEAGRVGGQVTQEQKKVLDAVKQTVTIQDMTECGYCRTSRPREEMRPIGKNETPICAHCQTLPPEKVIGYIQHEQRVKEGKVPTAEKKPSEMKPRDFDGWPEKLAHMQVSPSKGDLKLAAELGTLGIPPDVDDWICLWGCRPDAKYDKFKLAVFRHGPIHDKGKAMERDERVVMALEKMGWTVITFHQGNGNEKAWAQQVQEKLEEIKKWSA